MTNPTQRREAELEAVELIKRLADGIQAQTLYIAEPTDEGVMNHVELEQAVVALAARLRESAYGGEATE